MLPHRSFSTPTNKPFPMSRTLSGLLLLAVIAGASADEPPAEKILWSVDWKPDGSQFAVGGVNTLWLFDAKTFERKSLLSVRSQDNQQADGTEFIGVTSVSWHPFSNHLAVSSQGGNVNGIYDTDSGMRTPLKVDHGRGVDWSPKGDSLALTSPGDGHLRIFKLDGRLRHDAPRHKAAKGLTGVAWQPSGEKIVTIGKYITLHDANGTAGRQITHRPNAKGECLLLCVEWHPSGEFFVVGDYGNNDTADPPAIQLWSADGELMKTVLIDGGSEIRNISWNPAGTLLASASEKLRIWTKVGELKHAGDSPDLLWGVGWHPEGRRLLTSSAEGRVTLWTPDAEVSTRIVEAKSGL